MNIRHPWYLILLEASFVFGVVLGISFASTQIIDWLHHWQDLVAGIATIIAALIGGGFLWQQIHQADRLEKDRISTRHRAIRAVLPMSLSDISRYCEESALWLKKALAACSESDAIVGRVESAPPAPISCIADLKEFIEFSPPSVTNLMLKLISAVQVFDARMSDIRKSPKNRPYMVLKYNITSYIIDISEIYAYNNAYYNYARFKIEGVSQTISAGDVITAFHDIGFFGEENDQFYKIINRRYPTSGDKPILSPDSEVTQCPADY